MKQNEPESLSYALSLIVKAAVLEARWAGSVRRMAAESSCRRSDDRGREILMLRERVRELESRNAILRQQLRRRQGRPRYTLRERLQIIWFMEYFQIPRRKVFETFGVARSSLYRWLRRIEDQASASVEPANKTLAEIANLVWEVARANVSWGRKRIAHQFRALKVFIAASTVRRILDRPKPRQSPDRGSKAGPVEEPRSRHIRAFYPNHVWSMDRTIVRRWGLWPTYVLVAIDHFSRKVLAAVALEGPNAGWLCSAVEAMFRSFGSPRHVITDKEPVPTSEAFHELLDSWNVKHRLGAVGKHGSIAVTERVIRTLKYEWLVRVPLIRGFYHLERLCRSFVYWYNGWRPHALLDGACPDQWYCREIPETVERDAKVVPIAIDRRVFEETGVVGFRLEDAA